MTDDAPPGWLTISDLARERGVDKSAISRRVARLEGLGLISTRKQGKGKLVCLAEFDRAASSTVDAVREANGRRAMGPPDAGATGPGDPILAREQARRAAYDADMKRLDLEERLGRIVEAEAVRVALASCALELAQAIEALPGRAEALAAAVTKEGVAGLRAALKTVARELRETLARAAERFGEGGDAGDEAQTKAPIAEAAA
ncbi:MAG TPA: MarR family transcriptional regulator [Roseiarcus sp.]|nr:MarR family transcriptional regulator [Roseiarcus sp.]